jgi:transmembrane sensor
MEEEKLRRLIRKYINDECSEDEKHSLEKWYASFEHEADLLAFLSESEKEKLRLVLLKKIRGNIHAHKQAVTQKRYARISTPYTLAGIAALAILVAGLSWFASDYFRPAPDPLAGVVSPLTIANEGKNIRRVMLPDGSIAWLHPGSSLIYPEKFAGRERRITMTGEVFFEVTPDSLVPFIVYSRHLRTKVLGTSFRIRAYKEDPFANVSVLTGKVSVKRISDTSTEDNDTPEPGMEIVLTADESLSTSEQDTELRKERTAEDNEMGMWKKTNLTFVNIPMKEVLKKLNTAYDVRITAADGEINDLLLKADLTGMNLPDVLEILALSLDITYEIEQSTIVLKIPEP